MPDVDRDIDGMNTTTLWVEDCKCMCKYLYSLPVSLGRAVTPSEGLKSTSVVLVTF